MLKKIAQASMGAALALVAQTGHAYGEDGHSIVAEIAQRRLDAGAQAAINRLLSGGSMAAVSSWADDVRGARRETFNWHFVDIPMASASYDAARDCASSGKGDCVVAELDRLRDTLACAPTPVERKEALQFAIHFVGDIHQPLHAVLEKLGGNGQPVTGVIQGPACSRNGCDVKQQYVNLHALWDTGLIRMTYWSWGAYVEKLEAGLLKEPDILELGNSTNVIGWRSRPTPSRSRSGTSTRRWTRTGCWSSTTRTTGGPCRCSTRNSPWRGCAWRSSSTRRTPAPVAGSLRRTGSATSR